VAAASPRGREAIARKRVSVDRNIGFPLFRADVDPSADALFKAQDFSA